MTYKKKGRRFSIACLFAFRLITGRGPYHALAGETPEEICRDFLFRHRFFRASPDRARGYLGKVPLTEEVF
jgi:hypothetical protein